MENEKSSMIVADLNRVKEYKTTLEQTAHEFMEKLEKKRNDDVDCRKEFEKYMQKEFPAIQSAFDNVFMEKQNSANTLIQENLSILMQTLGRIDDLVQEIEKFKSTLGNIHKLLYPDSG